MILRGDLSLLYSDLCVGDLLVRTRVHSGVTLTSPIHLRDSLTQSPKNLPLLPSRFPLSFLRPSVSVR